MPSVFQNYSRYPCHRAQIGFFFLYITSFAVTLRPGIMVSLTHIFNTEPHSLVHCCVPRALNSVWDKVKGQGVGNAKLMACMDR